MEFNAHFFRAFGFKKTGGLISVKTDFRVSRIMADKNAVFFSEFYRFFEKRFGRAGRCRIIGVIQKHHFGFVKNRWLYFLQIRQKSVSLRERHETWHPSGKKRSRAVRRVT